MASFVETDSLSRAPFSVVAGCLHLAVFFNGCTSSIDARVQLQMVGDSRRVVAVPTSHITEDIILIPSHSVDRVDNLDRPHIRTISWLASGGEVGGRGSCCMHMHYREMDHVPFFSSFPVNPDYGCTLYVERSHTAVPRQRGGRCRVIPLLWYILCPLDVVVGSPDRYIGTLFTYLQHTSWSTNHLRELRPLLWVRFLNQSRGRCAQTHMHDRS